MKQILFTLLMLGVISTPAFSALQTREITYTDGETQLKGYLAYDDAVAGRRPGILVVHAWWGQNAYARKRAEMLAGLGYTALALDMYGEGRTADHPEDAAKFSSAVRKNMPLATKRFKEALDVLRSQPTVDPAKIAAIGYCFGGAIVLEMARDGLDLDGVASFHGTLETENPAQPGKVKARIRVFNGADDPFVTTEDIKTFKQEMNAAGADYRITSYPGTKHSFTNPDADKFGKEFGLPLAYNKEADEQSWRSMQDFFTDLFK